jgi:hypothetical protein
MLSDKYELYLDYQMIVQTTSAQTALSVLLSLYNNFEIKFQRHYSGIHLLYGVIFEDANELSESMRKLLLSWGYELKNKSIIHQHRVATTTTAPTITMNNIDTVDNTLSVEPSTNDLRVSEQALLIQNQELNDIDKEPTLHHTFPQTQESSKCRKKAMK